MVQFEGKERRMPKIEACLKEYGIESLEAARDLCLSKGVNVDEIVKGIQPIAFENAVWAYTLGTAIALKKGVKKAADAAETIGIGLQAFCVPGSVAETRSVGLAVVRDRFDRFGKVGFDNRLRQRSLDLCIDIQIFNIVRTRNRFQEVVDVLAEKFTVDVHR